MIQSQATPSYISKTLQPPLAASTSETSANPASAVSDDKPQWQAVSANLLRNHGQAAEGHIENIIMTTWMLIQHRNLSAITMIIWSLNTRTIIINGTHKQTHSILQYTNMQHIQKHSQTQIGMCMTHLCNHRRSDTNWPWTPGRWSSTGLKQNTLTLYAWHSAK